MALQLLALKFLLVLVSLLAARGREEPDPKVHGVPWETGMCQRPRWDPRLRLTPDQENYKKNEEVMLSCTDGFQPPFTHVKCSSEVQSTRDGKLVNREVWRGRNTRGDWTRIQSRVECVEVLQVVSESLEISSTSIKLNWTCRLPDACQHMRATCQLQEHSSPPCEAEEVQGEEMLQGQEGTFTCPPLQPYTFYNITISLPPSTILFSWLVSTKETGTWIDAPFCPAANPVSSPQLNITTRSAQDGTFLEMEKLQLSGSITEHRLPQHSPDSSYVVTIQGLTAAGAGAASLWEFQTKSSNTPHPLDISCRDVHDISPSHGTAVLPLRPIARPPTAAREHQLIVAVGHNSTALEGACLGEPQPFNASQEPGTYMAAVLNLTGPMDFVLGNGTHGQGYHNAALRPGWHYMALLRHVHRSQQVPVMRGFCYAGQHPAPWRGIVIGVVVLLVLLLLFAGILGQVQQGHGPHQSLTKEFPLPFQEKEVFSQ
uniref:Fibronectin type-III domain-containing protein n=1 Tax=Calidris pygmaea TaxID=425635 RepID=A0A8C3KMF3_9CHAR